MGCLIKPTIQCCFYGFLLFCVLQPAVAEESGEVYRSAESPCNLTSGFQCHDGGCIFLEERCDGDIECDDSSDEKGCPEIQCSFGERKCETLQKCIPFSEWCDRYFDCDDESDEKDCGNPIRCEDDDFIPCVTNRTSEAYVTCIPVSKVCDGQQDCENGAEEMNCPGSSIKKQISDSGTATQYVTTSPNEVINQDWPAGSPITKQISDSGIASQQVTTSPNEAINQDWPNEPTSQISYTAPTTYNVTINLDITQATTIDEIFSGDWQGTETTKVSRTLSIAPIEDERVNGGVIALIILALIGAVILLAVIFRKLFLPRYRRYKTRRAHLNTSNPESKQEMHQKVRSSSRESLQENEPLTADKSEEVV